MIKIMSQRVVFDVLALSSKRHGECNIWVKTNDECFGLQFNSGIMEDQFKMSNERQIPLTIHVILKQFHNINLFVIFNWTKHLLDI